MRVYHCAEIGSDYLKVNIDERGSANGVRSNMFAEIHEMKHSPYRTHCLLELPETVLGAKPFRCAACTYVMIGRHEMVSEYSFDFCHSLHSITCGKVQKGSRG